MMKTKTLVHFFTWPLLGLTTTAWAKDDLPKTEPFAHYQPMVKRSPFAVATANAPVVGKPDFAKDLYVANAAHSTDGDFVTIASTVDKNLKLYLNTKETVEGYSVSNIQWSDRVGETKVTIEKEGQFGTLTFNEALLSQAIQNPVPPAPQIPQPQPIPGRPTVNTSRPNGAPTPIRPMAVPQIPTPPPHVRPTIRRRGGPQQQAVQQPNVQPPGDEDDSELAQP